mgnify:CR=1 FL=1
MVDFAEQRLNMVESQVRPSDLTDRRIMNAMLEVRREAYLPPALQGVAYSDGELSLGSIAGVMGVREMLAPRTVAQMLQALELEASDIVLLAGTGSGYEAALLSHMVQTIVCVESDQGLSNWAEAALQDQDVGNAATVEGPLDQGFASEGPFDAIMINGGVDQVPAGLLDQLKDGGRLVAILREDGVTRLALWQRDGERYARREHNAAAACILPAFEREASFEF